MTVRVIINERDCDHMQVTYSRKAKNSRLMDIILERIYDNAEGMVNAQSVTKAEYEEFEADKRANSQAYRRDLAAEQAGY